MEVFLFAVNKLLLVTGINFMDFDWTTFAAADWLRLVSWAVSSALSLFFLIKILRFVAGFILGVIFALIAGWMFYQKLIF